MLQGYEKTVFEAPNAHGQVLRHDVYARGEGPVVVLIQELPGIGQETLRLADQFTHSGFSVVLPHLFGPLGRTAMVGNLVRVFCMRKEFRVFEKGGASPVVTWLRALCQSLKAERNVDGVAVIGMCLTGNFALSLMVDDSVLAAVASQPSLPLQDQTALHISADEVVTLRRRLDEHGPMMALRFEGDTLCQGKKFKAIAQTLNDDAERVRLRTLPGKGHSVLTLDFVDEAGHPTRAALDEVIGYFKGALGA
ncbi:MAG: dienelactone hydrolase family protein [Deltaproteobacteria bacterium]|nr:dienelactone hydrolase family protein [Deltaproteobacteria bacterium]